MNAKLLLRIAAVLTLLFCVGHTLGFPWVGTFTPGQLAQMDGINTIKTTTQGFARSYSDFHKAFGLYIAAMLLVQAIVLWQLGSLVKTEPRTSRFVTAALALLFAGTVVLNYFYLFWGPIIFSGVITLALLAAFYAQRPAKA